MQELAELCQTCWYMHVIAQRVVSVNNVLYPSIVLVIVGPGAVPSTGQLSL